MTAIAATEVSTSARRPNRKTFLTLCAIGVLGIAGLSMSRNTHAPTLSDYLQRSAMLSQAGDHEGALAASRKAVSLYRHLHRAAPIFFQKELATKLAVALDDLAARLSETGDVVGAEHTSNEAIALRREINAANQNVAVTPRDATPVKSAKAVEMNRHLYRAAPIFYQNALAAKLADSLDDLSTQFQEAGDLAGAQKANKEAVALRQNLKGAAAAVADRQSPRIDVSATIAGQDEAIATVRKSVGMYRHLVKAAPIFYQPALSEKLAASLSELSVLLSGTGNAEGARLARDEVNVLSAGQNSYGRQNAAL
jgi:hypothetical protein